MAYPEFLKTERKESFATWKFRTLMNWYPMYFGTGGKVLFWSGDSHEVHVQLKRSIWSYNYVGTIFGGSMFASTDPFYMIMLYKIVGDDYVVWDKAGAIKFVRPAKQTLYAKFLLTDELIAELKRAADEKGDHTYNIKIELIDKDQVVHAAIERTMYIATKAFYEAKKGTKKEKAKF